MASLKRENLLPYLRKLLGASSGDQELLERFIQTQDAGAFEMLLDRHGPLVRGVCMRALGNPTDADDAFQATFLILARNARSIRRRTALGPWLYGVAQRIAHKMRISSLHRRDCEKKAAAFRPVHQVDDMTLGELKRILDKEIADLPENFRAPLIMCCVEGKSRDEAAHELGWSLGAVKGRLERARDALRARLVRRGIAMSAALLALTLLQGTAAAAVPHSLVTATAAACVKIAGGQVLTGLVSAQTATLVHTFLRGMLLVKVKQVVGVFLLAGLVGSGVAVGPAVHESWRGAPAVEAKDPKASLDANTQGAAEPPPAIILPVPPKESPRLLQARYGMATPPGAKPGDKAAVKGATKSRGGGVFIIFGKGDGPAFMPPGTMGGKQNPVAGKGKKQEKSP